MSPPLYPLTWMAVGATKVQPAPTISSHLPLSAPSAGGYTANIIGTNFTVGTTVTVGTASPVLLVIDSPTTAHYTIPAYPGGNTGTSTPQKVIVSNANGSATLASNIGGGGVVYYPVTPLLHYFGGVWSLDANNNIQSWTNLATGSFPLGQNTITKRPRPTGSYNSRNIPAAFFMTGSVMTASQGLIHNPQTFAVVSNKQALNGFNQSYLFDFNNSSNRVWMAYGFNTPGGIDIGQQSNSFNLNPANDTTFVHAWGLVSNGTGSITQVDTSASVARPTGLSQSVNNVLLVGENFAAGAFLSGSIGEFIMWDVALTSAQLSMSMAGLKATWGTF